MYRIPAFLCLVFFLGSVGSSFAEWKPGKAPLMTKWGKTVSPDKAWPEYPRPQMQREQWENLNGLWDYAITKADAPLPEKYTGQILVPFPLESALSGVMNTLEPNQALWYRRTTTISKQWNGQRILLHFGAVDWDSKVYVNGKEVGKHRGGSDPFHFDITEQLKDGEKTEIVVRVVDPTDGAAQPRGKQVRKPGGIFYTSVTGIWQTVWMEPVNKPGHITGLKIDTNLEKNEVTVEVQMSQTLGNTFYSIEVLDGDKVVGKTSGLDTKTIKIPDAKHWTPETPHLYRLLVSVSGMKRESGRDAVESYFAFRKISAAKDEKGVMRLMLNNKPLFQIGPLDQGWWPDGLLTPPSDEAMKYDLEVLKKLGFNMLRKHVKVEPARLYYHCDRLGLLVWQDMPSAGVPSRGHFIKPDVKEDAKFSADDKAQFKAEWKAIMEHLSFFPCIVVWVPFNEGWGQHDTNDILKWTMQADPTRLVDGPSGWTDRGVGHMKDAHIYPGPGMFPVMTDRVSVLGEFGGLGLPLEGHLWTDQKNWGYRTYKSREELRDNYRILMTQLRPLIGKGLAAAVYTQTTDVETEVNGLMTYDREVIKLDVNDAVAWHRKLFGPPPEIRTLVESSQEKGQKWHYTTTAPPDGWFKTDYDHGKWQSGEGGFGTKGTPGSVIRTTWDTKDIWIRRTFELKAVPDGEIALSIHHDEDIAVYINGVQVAKVTGYTTDYTVVPLTAEGRKALKTGANVIAIHCRQTGGGQYIDAGLVEIKEK